MKVNQEVLSVQIPSLGWRQILTARQRMLNEFDSAREQAKSHEVETYHGNIGEAYFRKWLKGFLPKRYGVTPGYVVSPGLKDSDKLPHFDVIIYDQLESPILWIEDNPDSSHAGQSQAIPAEYVRAVMEVKSAFATTTAKAALEHLHDLDPLLQSSDTPGERYKLYLPRSFFCGVVYFELRKADAKTLAPLDAMIDLTLRGYVGGIVLRAEGQKLPMSANIELLMSLTQDAETAIGELPLFAVAMTERKPRKGRAENIGSMLMWSDHVFAQFAFDVVARLQGTYERGRASSFYGLPGAGLRKIKPQGEE